MKVLSFETTGNIGSLSLYIEGRGIVIKKVIKEKRDNSRRLVSLICEVLDLFDLSVNDLDAIVSCKGPGSFTGIRIGLAVMVGFQVSGISAKLYAPSAFDILKYKNFKKGEKLLVSIDSGRGDYFVTIYDEFGKTLLSPTNYSDKSILESEYNVKSFSEFDSDDLINWFVGSAQAELKVVEGKIEPFYIRPPDVTLANKGNKKSSNEISGGAFEF